MRGIPRRTTACERTSSSGSMVAAELHGGSSSAARHTSYTCRRSSSTYAASLRAGSDAAYVLELRRQVYDVCRAALELPPWSSAATIEPLLDVRSHAVVRRGIPRMTLDWDGTLRLAPP